METRLFPYGKSGLKCLFPRSHRQRALSLPVWEEWIEIVRRADRRNALKSLPVWEEWIEIGKTALNLGRAESLPVWEEWIEMRW